MTTPCFPGLCVRHDLQARCDGLERDKAALLAERDEARDLLATAVNDRDRLASERDALREALETARAKALEEAARIADGERVPEHQGGGKHIDGRNMAAASIAAQLRALAAKETP